jgi:hypothetical protein
MDPRNANACEGPVSTEAVEKGVQSGLAAYDATTRSTLAASLDRRPTRWSMSGQNPLGVARDGRRPLAIEDPRLGLGTYQIQDAVLDLIAHLP